MSGIKLTEKQKDDLDKLTIAIEREESLTENYHDKVHLYIMKYVNSFRVANGANSENANCAIFDVSGSLPSCDKIRETSNRYARNRYYEQENPYDTTVSDFEAGVKWLLGYMAGQ